MSDVPPIGFTEATFGGRRPLRGRLRVPGDKSLSHRALLLAAIGSGRSHIRHLAPGADVAASGAALRSLGVTIREVADATEVTGNGFDGLRESETVLDCGNSGTTMRILAGLVAGRPMLSILTGDGSLCRRPMGRVSKPLREMGARVDGRADAEFAPLSIRGGGLRGIEHTVPIASAQVKSALMLAALQASGSSSVTEPAQSRDHSERMLRALGAPVRVDGLTVYVDPLTAPWSAFDAAVPGDPSSAAFFVVAATITPQSEIVLEEVAINPTRLGFVDVLLRMGADIEVRATGEVLGEPVGDIAVRSATLRATNMSGSEIPRLLDEIPVLAVAAAFAEGVTDIADAAELVVKESNRIGAIQQELAQLGIGVEARRDGLVIRGGHPRAGAALKSHGDHRMAMAAAVAAHALDGESTVRGWQIVGVSYPCFDDDLRRLAGQA